MRMIVVSDDTVQNIIEAEAGFTLDGFEVIAAPEGVGIGWTRSAGVWSAPPEPETPPRTRLSRLEFRGRFTEPEKIAIYTAAESSVQVRIWLDDLAAAEFIELTDPRTIADVGALETAGLIAPGRAAEILAGIAG
jgi:hypothetical protein